MTSNAERAIKRAMDVAGASIGLVFLSPVIGLAACAVAITMGRPILYRQIRPGLGGRPFTIFKIRTMLPSTVDEITYLTDLERLTPVGRFLRRTSIDEIPELWNVLTGDMSLVGPRPLLMEYLDRYTEEQARRHDVRPGITGWAQVNGRQELPFKERFELDVWYVDNWDLMLDVRILLKTCGRVIHSSGVVTETVDEMPTDDSFT
jgi:lipopolysaccharide/colanic/teichoic acid biosynthesis glycosyltransferase